MRLVAAGAAGFLILLVISFYLGARPPAVNDEDIWTASVDRGQLLHVVTATGTLVAPELRAITNRNAGVVERVVVLAGERVAPGDVLLEMSSPQLEEELASAQSELEAARADSILQEVQTENEFLDLEADVASAEVEYLSARIEYEAMQEVGQLTSEVELERARLRTEQLQRRLEAMQTRLDGFGRYRSARLEASRVEVSRREQQVQRLQNRVEDLKVKASIEGVVQEVNAEEGERLEAGQPVARIVNPEYLIARVSVSERNAGLIRIGQPVRLEVGRDVLPGTVSRIDPTVRDRVVTLDVALDHDTPVDLRPDLSVTARVEIERLDDVLVLDRPAGLSEGQGSVRLYRVISGGDRAERVDVEVGRASASQIEVIDGLNDGDRVILADMSDWLDEPVLRIE